MPYTGNMFTFIESLTFEKILPLYPDDAEYAELQQFMMTNPEIGEVVPGSGGVPKLRWKRRGMGKRGGIRVVYYLQFNPNEFWMLALYSKNKLENAPSHILKQLKKEFKDE